MTGPDFIALQVRDLERAAAFYERALGLERAAVGPPHAVVFATEPIPFAVREPLPGVNLEGLTRPGLGVALWLACDDALGVCESVRAAGADVLREPEAGPFGLNFSFADLDGYAVTVHEVA